jgi:CheY-like chemotaxis protein
MSFWVMKEAYRPGRFNGSLAVGGHQMLRVLVVDDSKDYADTLATIVRLNGYQVDVTMDGASALKAAEMNWPDAVLLDLGMPIMDGFEVARRIRLMAAERPMPLLIAVTGYGDNQIKLRCLAEGFDLHLLKTVRPSELLEVLADGLCEEG